MLLSVNVAVFLGWDHSRQAAVNMLVFVSRCVQPLGVFSKPHPVDTKTHIVAHLISEMGVCLRAGGLRLFDWQYIFLLSSTVSPHLKSSVDSDFKQNGV